MNYFTFLDVLVDYRCIYFIYKKRRILIDDILFKIIPISLFFITDDAFFVIFLIYQ